MQRSLKLKLQNAINQAFADAGSPAIFVGGRRHNRKKRKSKNGQIKKKNKKVEVTSQSSSSITSLSEYYDDVEFEYIEPKVSCLDIKEPVFAVPSTKSRLKEADRDSMYNSSESLSSYTSERSASSEKGFKQQTSDKDESTDTIAPYKVGVPRLDSRDSRDSGVYDDDDEDYDVGFCDEITADYDNDNAYECSVQQELSEASADDNELEDEPFLLVIDNELELSDATKRTADVEDLVTEAPATTETIDEFEKAPEVPVDGEVERVLDDDIDGTDAAVLQVDNEGHFEVKPLQGLEDTDPFLKLVNSSEDEEEVVFDLSQLEVNNLDGISKTKEINAFEQQTKDQEVPTDLEDETPLTVPLDLLQDEDDDEVLFEAAPTRKELAITCNPLYDYTVMEEEDKLSIKSYQSGFKTDFDNIGFTQISVPASDKAAHKSLKESTPLIKRQPICGDRDDELACCVIL